MNNETSRGSHMPLDIEPHFSWRNPVNLLPLGVLLLLAEALIRLVAR